MRLIIVSSMMSAVVIVLFYLWLHQEEHSHFHRQLLLPGQLAKAHAFIEAKCSTCHTPLHGIEAVNCIQCHAADEHLLGRQPTAFHATAATCNGCHVEHQGRSNRPTAMDHEVLLSMAIANEQRDVTSDVVAWLRRLNVPRDSRTPDETLHCVTCHANQDKHVKLFGDDCAACHTTASWKIGAFRHPSPKSQDCAQCHQAPPSHYMGHFHMVSKKIAGVEHANVNECFLCHQTTSWNDIRGVGWYKHH